MPSLSLYLDSVLTTTPTPSTQQKGEKMSSSFCLFPRFLSLTSLLKHRGKQFSSPQLSCHGDQLKLSMERKNICRPIIRKSEIDDLCFPISFLQKQIQLLPPVKDCHQKQNVGFQIFLFVTKYVFPVCVNESTDPTDGKPCSWNCFYLQHS